MRFAFCKSDDTLREAASRLAGLKDAVLPVAAGTGWISLALTLNRCRNMSFDLKPKPLH